MIYLYPKLSDIDLMFMRIGGAGLGNILFPYVRALVYQRDHADTQIIWPTWFNVKAGPIIHRDLDKRFYNDLFVNRSDYIDGFQKAWLLLTRKHISEKELLEGRDASGCVVEFTGMDNCFEKLMEEHRFIYDNLVANLNSKYRSALEFDGTQGVCMHIRLGDFTRVSWEEVKQGKHNSVIPIEWYVAMAKSLRSILGEKTKMIVFSDGKDEELQPLLDLGNVDRVCFGSSIADILALSRAKILVASGSSFSMWARYLGRMTTIMFPNQVKQKILTEKDSGREIVALEEISLDDAAFIKETW